MSTQMAKAAGTAGNRIYRENSLMLPAAKPPEDAFSKKRARLLEVIQRKSLLKGKFKLASGAWSNYYLDMKPTTFDAEGANLVADIVHSMLDDDREIEAIGGLEVGSVPIVVGVVMRSWGSNHPLSGFVVRKEKKGHGTDKLIDGNFRPSAPVVLFEDVTTKGDSVMQAVREVRAQGGRVNKIITLVDRLEGAAERLRQEKIDFEAIYTAPELLR